MVAVDVSKVRRAAVLGSPIDHSKSPQLYRAGFVAAGLATWRFDAIECDGDRLPSLLADCDGAWAGFAVTMPGKQAAAAVADARSARVNVLGVANTLVRRDGLWYADNTDVDGVVGALTERDVSPTGPVLLLGGGGTARAVLAALAEMHWAGPVILAGRTPRSTVIAQRLATTLGLNVSTIGMTEPDIEAIADTVALAVSTVPAGAADHLAPTLANVPAIFDVIYDPWPTPLAAAGNPARITVTGLDMLLHQAVTQFTLITGVAADSAAMRTALTDPQRTDARSHGER